MIARPHDLLGVDAALAATWDAPAWVADSLARAPWVVVRRAVARGCGIAVGIRGATRAERYAADVQVRDVRTHVRPYDLTRLLHTRSGSLARAARGVDDAARRHALAWGPTGSFGFEIASGIVVTNAASDLDGIVAHAAPETLASFARACAIVTRETGVRIDLEVQLGNCGVALAEYLGDARRVLAKTGAGPVFVAR